MNYSNKLMLVDLSISVWTGRKFDRAITKEVADRHNTGDNVGRYNKNLFPSNPPSYKAVLNKATQARAKHNSLTLPWNDDGCRVLAARAYMDYTDAMRTEQLGFESAVNDFIPVYPSIVAESLRLLNGMALMTDYPEQRDLEKYFSMSLRFLPFPDAGDMRVNLPQADVDAIKSNVEESVRLSLQNSIQDPFRRLLKVVAHMSEALANPDAIFRDSLVSNVEDLRAILPTLNITDDPQLDALIHQTDALIMHEPDTLRHNPGVRSSIAEKAEAMKKQLEGYLV